MFKNSKSLVTRNNNNSLRSMFTNKKNNFSQLFDEVDAMFDDVMHGYGISFLDDYRSSNIIPPISLIATKDSYKFTTELPGMNKEDINIEFDQEKNTLIVEGEKQSIISDHENDCCSYFNEIRSGKFRREIQLPNKVDSESMEATYENGVLRIEIKTKEKEEKTNNKKIDIT